MNKKLTLFATTIAGLALVASVPLASAEELEGQERRDTPSAEDGSKSGRKGEIRNAMRSQREEQMKERGEQEIKRRLEALNRMSNRIGEMKRLSDDDKSELKSELENHARDLAELQTKIQRETSTTTLKDDVKSITDSYRTFALVMPKTAIIAAADRIKTIVTQMTALGTKLQARIDAAPAGTDTGAAKTALADFNAKVANAKVQAEAAIALVVDLKPDNGDATVKAANLAALKDARAKIQAARQDLIAARKAVEAIRKSLPKVKPSGSATTTTP